jgi:predicted membrane channel-forming protein YqfA (hemolysin III family)
MIQNISNKTRAILGGVFIIVVYGVLVSSITQSKIMVMFADVISGLAVIGIAVLMYPLFKETNKQFSKGYLFLKYAEGISMIIGGILFLSTSLQYTRGIIYEDFHVYVFIISAFMFYYILDLSHKKFLQKNTADALQISSSKES